MEKMSKDFKLLKQKLEDLKLRENLIVPKESVVGRSKSSYLGFRIAIELLSALVVGTGLGYVLDMFFSSKPWMMVVFLLFGGAAGVLNVYRLSKQESEQK